MAKKGQLSFEINSSGYTEDIASIIFDGIELSFGASFFLSPGILFFYM